MKQNGEPCQGCGPQKRAVRGEHDGNLQPEKNSREKDSASGEQARRKRYAALPVEGQLRENLRRLGHMLYHSTDHRGGQFRAMAVLASCGTMGQRELGEYLDVRAGSLSELLAKLEAAGYIARSTNEQDRRNTDVALTESGRAASAAHEAQRAEKTRAMFESLNAEEKRQLNTLLERLTEDWRVRVFPPEAPEPAQAAREAQQSRCRRGHRARG